jgi:hypothetical protein
MSDEFSNENVLKPLQLYHDMVMMMSALCRSTLLVGFLYCWVRSLKHVSTGRHTASFGQIILISSQSVFALSEKQQIPI